MTQRQMAALTRLIRPTGSKRHEIVGRISVSAIRHHKPHRAELILLGHQDRLRIRFQRFKDVLLIGGITNIIALA